MRLTVCSPAPGRHSSAALPASAQRLPTIVTPSHYDLTFVVDLEPRAVRGDRDDSRPGRPSRRRAVVLQRVRTSSSTRSRSAPAPPRRRRRSRSTRRARRRRSPCRSRSPRAPTEIHIRFSGILNTSCAASTSARPSCASTRSRSSSRPTRAAPSPASTSRRSRRPSRVTLTIDRGDTAISNGKRAVRHARARRRRSTR